MTIAIYLAHLNPVTNAHAEIIKDLAKEDNVVVMPVRFLVGSTEINSKSFPFTFNVRDARINIWRFNNDFSKLHFSCTF